MPFKSNAAIWWALLGACRLHRDYNLAGFAARNLLELDLDDSGSYVLLANTYSNCGQLELFIYIFFFECLLLYSLRL
ncbi:putative tetratricopeptide-like helical domain-containing protein [Rosa chinensis]|uniref:Putative tetratricopeptide-like helical domain-containing protein n=1 Tax=Rosa chinensis TaxID=74649 RepID=A0A2P6PZ91_ROSCH|nr:putative tetratricopeptide-like helical domain-containing protein [Rosa chinensis]